MRNARAFVDDYRRKGYPDDRVAAQLTLLNHALMPKFSTAVARSNARLQRYFATLATDAAILLPGAFVLLVFGQKIVVLWTHGTVHPSFDLIIVMTAVMLVNGMWHPVSNLILAANRHASYSYTYLAAAIASVALTYPLSLWRQATGAGLALLALDCFMFIVVMRLAYVQIIRQSGGPGARQEPIRKTKFCKTRFCKIRFRKTRSRM